MDFNTASLTPLAVLLPFIGAALAFLLIRRARAQRIVSNMAVALTLALEVYLLVYTFENGPQAIHMGGWSAPFGITLVLDQFSALMLVVSSAVSLAVLVYASGQGAADGDEGEPISIFHPAFLILVAGVSYAFLAGDLFNLYVGFEILLTASYVLITLGGSSPRIRAGVTYVVVSVVSSMLFLVSIALVYATTGTINLADLAVKLRDVDPGTQVMLHLMLLVAFGIKAAVFPLSFWLPDSYPTAPAPVTAVFAGLLTKVGVYAIIRIETLLFPEDNLNTLLMVIAALTMIVGILGALAQTDIKRLLSFTLVSHIGYMIFGVALSSVVGLGATIYYVVHHIIVQTALFLVAGLIERRAGTTAIDRIGGMAKIAPLLAVLYFIPAMNLGGIPPFSGFLGKLGLMQGGVQLGTPIAYVLVAVSVIASLLTLLAMARVWNRVFLRDLSDARYPDPVLVATQNEGTSISSSDLDLDENDLDEDGKPSESSVRLLPLGMVAPTIAIVLLSLALTIFAGPLYQFADDAAADMLNRTPYIDAVLGTSGVKG